MGTILQFTLWHDINKHSSPLITLHLHRQNMIIYADIQTCGISFLVGRFQQAVHKVSHAQNFISLGTDTNLILNINSLAQSTDSLV